MFGLDYFHIVHLQCCAYVLFPAKRRRTRGGRTVENVKVGLFCIQAGLFFVMCRNSRVSIAGCATYTFRVSPTGCFSRAPDLPPRGALPPPLSHYRSLSSLTFSSPSSAPPSPPTPPACALSQRRFTGFARVTAQGHGQTDREAHRSEGIPAQS